MSLLAEINEQPRRIASLLSAKRKTVEKLAAGISGRGIQYVFLAARGASGNAGRYANYCLAR